MIEAAGSSETAVRLTGNTVSHPKKTGFFMVTTVRNPNLRRFLKVCTSTASVLLHLPKARSGSHWDAIVSDQLVTKRDVRHSVDFWANSLLPFEPCTAALSFRCVQILLCSPRVGTAEFNKLTFTKFSVTHSCQQRVLSFYDELGPVRLETTSNKFTQIYSV